MSEPMATVVSAGASAKSIGGRIFGGSSTIQATGRFLRNQLWAWPIIAAIVFGGAGWWVNHAVETAMHDQRADDLNAMVDASAKAVVVWMGEQRINVQLFAADEQVPLMVAELLPLAHGKQAERQLEEAQGKLRERLKPKLKLAGYAGYFVVAPNGTIIAADHHAPLGQKLDGYRKEIFDTAIAGKTLVSKPYRTLLLLADEKGNMRPNLPTMFAVGPVKDKDGKIIAALGVRIRPDDNFTRILHVVQFGESGETFAFDKHGVLLTQSRFDDTLKQIGLLPDQPDAQSILTVAARDPGVNMMAKEIPKLRRSEQPLTRSVADAVQGKDGCDANGYRGYRGVEKVGAWRWLKEYDFGIATEVDAAEAFRPIYILRVAFWVLMGLLVLSAIAIFCAMLFMARQQKALQTATQMATQLGQYKLEEKLGAGGMGTVYRARHAMLRRPTAVKLLDVDKMSETAIARFEREVQLTSSLTHPNTVAVYDYGRTPEGVFYYAMEYLEGVDLDRLVTRFGPVLEARLLFILRQVCGSLAEAHIAGLVHRDVKPANIFLTRRGGQADFVKVLDFGLAKSVAGQHQANVTNPNTLLGTPYYMAPEAVNRPETVDARADVYAVGAVAYFMLTGTPVFDGETVMEICMKHVNEKPVAPSKRIGRPVSPALEELILRCLAKSQADRPKNAADLLRELEECPVEGKWTALDATMWWMGADTCNAAQPQPEPTPVPDSTMAVQ